MWMYHTRVFFLLWGQKVDLFALQGSIKFTLWPASIKNILCPNGRKKSHCMLVRRAACSQLCLGVKIGRNVHNARFKGRKCSYRPKLDCPRLTTHSHATRLFPPIWTQNVVCTSSDTVVMWLVWIHGTLCTRHNRHHAALGTQSTIIYIIIHTFLLCLLFYFVIFFEKVLLYDFFTLSSSFDIWILNFFLTTR